MEKQETVAIRIIGQHGSGIVNIPREKWDRLSPVGRVLAIHEARRDLTKGQPFEVLANHPTG